MILALNIGNSNITFGGYTPDGKLVFSSRLFADTALSSDELLYANRKHAGAVRGL